MDKGLELLVYICGGVRVQWEKLVPFTQDTKLLSWHKKFILFLY